MEIKTDEVSELESFLICFSYSHSVTILSSLIRVFLFICQELKIRLSSFTDGHSNINFKEVINRKRKQEQQKKPKIITNFY